MHREIKECLIIWLNFSRFYKQKLWVTLDPSLFYSSLISSYHASIETLSFSNPSFLAPSRKLSCVAIEVCCLVWMTLCCRKFWPNSLEHRRNAYRFYSKAFVNYGQKRALIRLVFDQWLSLIWSCCFCPTCRADLV